MNKKFIIIATIVLVVIITAIIMFKPKNDSKISSLQGNEITKKEYDENIMNNLEQQLFKMGIEIVQSETVRFNRINGNIYTIIEDGKETDKTFEVYIVNAKEKRQILGQNIKNGKVTTADKTAEGILNNNILILNISDEGLTNQIINVFNT